MVSEFHYVRRKGWRRWIAIVFVNVLIWGLIVLGVYTWLNRRAVIEVQSIVSSRTITVSARQDGQLGTIHFDRAQRFNKGDLLFSVGDEVLLSKIRSTSETIQSIDNSIAEEESDLTRRLREYELQMDIESTRQTIRESEQQIENRKVDLARAEERVARRQDALERARKLVEKGVLTMRDLESKYLVPYEDAVAARDAIEREITLLQEKVEGFEKTLELNERYRSDLIQSTAQTLRQLREKRQAEEGLLAELQIQKQNLQYVADISGYVVRRHKESLDYVKAGDPVLEITTGQDIWVDAYFLPEQENLVAEGDQVMIRYGTQLFPAIIESKSVGTFQWPFAGQGLLSQPARYVVVKENFVNHEAAKRSGMRPGMIVTTEVTRDEGVLYRLGIRQPNSAQPTATPVSPREEAPDTSPSVRPLPVVGEEPTTPSATAP